MENYRDVPPDPEENGPVEDKNRPEHHPPPENGEGPEKESGTGPESAPEEPDATGADAAEADSAEFDAADPDTAEDEFEASLQAGLDGVVGDSRALAAVEAYRYQRLYTMLQNVLERPDLMVDLPVGTTRADLTGDDQGWVRSALTHEVAAAMGVAPGHAAGLINDAEALFEGLPNTAAALEMGEVTSRHVQTMIRQATGLDAEATQAFEEQALAKAKLQTPTQFARAAVRVREGLFPETITERKKEAVKDRHVDCYGTPDGMGVLSVYAPIETVQGVYNASHHTARALKAAGDERTLAQIETDTVVDAMLIGLTIDTEHKPGVGASGLGGDRLGKVCPTVYVTVPAMTLLGRSDEPAQLDGYGPIDPETARELAAHAPSFTRLLTHPETGAVLSVGRDSYKVPADLKRAVELRDQTCVGIGCDKPATTCDLDHQREWQHGGKTSLTNINSACEPHHMLRHHTKWRIESTEDGHIVWVSPLGRIYRVPRTSNVQFVRTNGPDDDGRSEARVTNEVPRTPQKEWPDTPPF